eukprot:TRINITY_DN24_c0_g1_i6.p1 TRINITY_DN24_c0_g1~~TRINITY_DN24_c0_g1_i6.p1  ORF type:complete len:248 (-),score=48.54 TRINITY_DN24_c0_g1_i6:202-945(-)
MQKLNERQMATLLKNCPSINCLRHSKAMSIFKSLVDDNGQLELPGMELINISIKKLSEVENLHILPKLFPNLKSLTLRDDTYDENAPDVVSLESPLAQALCEILPLLRHLEHICLPGVAFNLIVRELPPLPNVKKLALPGGSLVDDDLRYITHIFPSVEDASFPGNSIGDAAVLTMHEAWGQNLKTLSLDGTEITTVTSDRIQKGGDRNVDPMFSRLESVYLPNSLQTDEIEEAIRPGVETFWCISR